MDRAARKTAMMATPQLHLLWAIGANDYNTVVRLIETVDVNEATPPSALPPTSHESVYSKEETDKMFIEWGYPVFPEDDTFPLIWACSGVLNTKIIKALLVAGANPNKQTQNGITPLHCAVQEIASAVKILLKYGADPTIVSKYGSSPLDIARVNYPAKYKLLLAALPPEKQPPIDLAAYTVELFDNLTSEDCDDVAAEEFIKAGADINAIHKSGRTILTHIIEHANGISFDSTLDLKPDINKIDGRGKSPLLCVVEYLDLATDQIGFAEGLLEAGANPNLVHAAGSTALMAASGRGQVDVVKALLKAGADKTMVDDHGRRAIDHVREALTTKESKHLRAIEKLLTLS